MTKRILFIVCFFIFSLHNIIAADYYWVGGSGKWSEISHWATSSGGSVTYAQTPTANDNVIFDANSFNGPNQTITFDDDNMFCRNITVGNVGNNPRFLGSANSKLNIYGNITISDNCNWAYQGNILFQSTDNGILINFGNKTAAKNISFTGSGSWSLQSPLIVEEVLSINAGSINFGNHRIECKYLASISTAQRNINFNESTWVIKGKSNIINNFWLDDPSNLWSVKLNVQNLTTSSNNSKIELLTSQSDILFLGSGTAEIPGLKFSSTSGKSSLRNNFNFSVNITLKGDIEANHSVFLYIPLNFRNLIPQPGVNIGFLAGANYKLNSIMGNGTCGKYITLLSFPTNEFATIEATAAATVSFYQINNIKLIGSGTANNSIKLGSTQGWTINEKSSQNFYWVGRDGNWSDGSKWSLTSGGVGAGCVPSAVDNVFFDNNSFSSGNQTIKVNEENVYCKDMKWLNIVSGAGLEGDLNKTIQIFGSLELSSVMQYSYDGEYQFLGSGNNTIISKGKIFTRDVYFNNDQGVWTISDNFENERQVVFASGKLIFNNVTATLNRFISTDKTKRDIELRNSLLLFKYYHIFFPSFQVQTENLTVAPGNSEIRFSSATGTFSANGNAPIHLNKLNFEVANSNITNSAESAYPQAIIHAKHVIKRGSGYLAIRAEFDTLTLTHGNYYELPSRTSITLKKLITIEECKGFVSINKSYIDNDNSKPRFIISSTDSYNKFSLKDISVSGSAPVRLLNSIDRGGNTGWLFDGNTQGRTLYYIGKNENWNDSENWSLTSGGIGGQCIPTEIDNVIFDNNSRLNILTYLYSGSYSIFCKNLLFNSDNNLTYVNWNYLYVYGNIVINRNINNFNPIVSMMGPKDSIQEVVTVPNFDFYFFIKRSQSILNLRSDLHTKYELSIIEGIFNSNDHKITVGSRLNMGSYTESLRPTINFGNSLITINGIYQHNINPLHIFRYAVVNGLNSTINLTGQSTGFSIYDSNVKLGKVEATNISGKSFNNIYLNNVYIRNLTLRGDGDFSYSLYENSEIGKLTMDSLVLSPGKSYVIQNNSETVIQKYLQSRGNNCKAISISSRINGSKARISMPTSAQVNMDFTQLRDLQGIGGATFNAGPYSTNIANSNVGWTFPPPTAISEQIGFLGPDKVLCPGENVLTLDASSFTPDETYRWSNGSTNSKINVTASGIYHVTVTFGNACVTKDTIKVSIGADIKDFLPNDTVLCNENSFKLNSKINDNNFRYLWSDGSTATEITVTNSGIYKLQIQNENCTFRDSVNISFLRVDQSILPTSINLCSGDSAVLSANGNYDRWRWQNGSTNSTQVVKNAGLYWVEVSKGDCRVADSTIVSVTPKPIFNLGRDTSICEGSSLVLSTGSPDVVKWNTGSTTSTINVNRSGTYIATKGQTGCTFSDTIVITVHPIPTLNLGDDLTLCSGDSARLGTSDQSLIYLWSNGSTNPSITVNRSGQYSLRVTNPANCSVSDTVNVSEINIIKPNLGRDTFLCEKQQITLNFIPQQNTTALWSTGVNTNTISVSKGGTYWVEISQGSCKKRDSIDITVLPLPVITSPSKYNICDQATTNVTITGTFDNIIWSNGQTRPSISIDKAGRYTYTVNRGSCRVDSSVSVNLIPIPDPNLEDSKELCRGDKLTLTAPDFKGNIQWSTGENSRVINIRNGGVYKLTLSENGCLRQDSINIILINCDGDALYFPNVFSPIKFSIDNQFFTAIVDERYTLTEYDLKIYDRLGSLVFSTNDINTQWEGKLNNVDLMSGVYSYICRYSATGRKNLDNKIITGSVTLIR